MSDKHLAEKADEKIWCLPFNYPAARASGYSGTEAEAYEELGVYLADKGQISDALSALRRAAELDPMSSRTLYYLAGVLSRLGNLEEAAEVLAKAVALAPDHWVTVFNLGKILARLSRHEEAIKALGQAALLNPKATSPLVERAKCYAAVGQVARAVEDLQAALEIDPYSKRIARLLDNLQRLKRPM